VLSLSVEVEGRGSRRAKISVTSMFDLLLIIDKKKKSVFDYAWLSWPESKLQFVKRFLKL